MRPVLLSSFLVLTALTLTAQTPSQFEQILVPFDTMTLEAGNARWRSELWVRNNGVTPVNVWAQECVQFGQPVACSKIVQVPAGRTMLLDGFDPDGASPGVLLYVARDRARDVTFNLRVRDLNRGADAVGTEIPVVREAEMASGITSLINVPLQPGRRVHLRIYIPDNMAAFTVRIYAEPGGQLLEQAVYAVATPADGMEPPELPQIVDASSIFRGWAIDRVHVTIERIDRQGIQFWPLLTITNRNNQVTTVTPQ